MAPTGEGANDPDDAGALAYARLHQGYVALFRGDLDLAVARGEEALTAAAAIPQGFNLNGALWLLANAALSYAYTKDEIVSVAGTFYALAAYAAIRRVICWTEGRPNRIVLPIATAALFLASAGWAVRVAGQHYALRTTAFVTGNDWASLPPSLSETDPEKRAIVERLRNDALERRVVAPYFVPRWQQRWFDE